MQPTPEDPAEYLDRSSTPTQGGGSQIIDALYGELDQKNRDLFNIRVLLQNPLRLEQAEVNKVGAGF